MAQEATMMKTRTKLTGVAAVLTLTALGGGIGYAQATGPAPTDTAVTTEVTSPDNDALQEGDQSAPDTVTGAAATGGVDTAAKNSARGTTNRTATEDPGAEDPGEKENVNDGPGGHEDPPGDVQHEGGPNEP
jgi:hypothetical protein